MSDRSTDVFTPQSHARDLAALLALQSMWRGREVSYIAATLLDALVSLLRLDVAYIRLDDPRGGAPLEDRRPIAKTDAHEIGKLLAAPELANQPIASVSNPFDEGTLRLIRFDPQLDRERGHVIAASVRPDFPTEIESFLFRTAVQQGMVAIQASRLLRDLQEANDAKSAFLATMSHELRTPLNAILGYVDLLDAEVAGPINHDQRDSLSRVKSGARHLMHLIEGILTFARVDAGKEELYLSKVDIVELVKETAALMRPLAEGKGLEFRVRVPEHPVIANTDAGKVRQILLNLLSNAVKFTQRGVVTLETRVADGTAEFRVIDTGIGIKSSDLTYIFEPFRQIGHVYTKSASGTGLGLTVAKQLALLLGGDITVESKPQEGSIFTARIPL